MSSINVDLDLQQTNRMKEISLDGKESYVEKLSPSAKLLQFAQQIDFNQLFDHGDEENDNASTTNEKEENSMSANQTVATRPWDSVQSSLRSALVEISALADLLKVSGQKKYVVLDPVQGEKSSSSSMVQLLAKKKNLSGAASILRKGSDEIGQYDEDGRSGYYSNLAKLRKNWKLRRIGPRIVGDLTLVRSIGAPAMRSFGIFEVSKLTVNKKDNDSFLNIILGTHIRGRSSINISLFIDGNEINTCPTTFLHINRTTWPLWHRKLKDAQNVLFCKILFNKLVQESYQGNNQFQCRLIGNKLEIKLADRIWLCIIDHHFYDESDQLCEESQINAAVKDHFLLQSYCYILEHALQNLLQEMHKKPNTNSKGRSGKKRANQKDTSTKKNNDNTSILWNIIPQIQHMLLRRRVAKTIDSVACSVYDACMCVHWHNLSCSKSSTATIIISQKNARSFNRKMLRLTVESDKISAICPNNAVFSFKSDVHSVAKFLESEVHSYLCDTIIKVGIAAGWHQLLKRSDTSTRTLTERNQAFHIVLLSPNKQTSLYVRVNPLETISFFAKILKDSTECPKSQGNDLATLKKINWERIYGTTLNIRLRMLFAALA
ncbi:Mediator of RNA polymerase II transcription subunit 17 [Trichoplax sp. H2]|nr:Mediator of RNA polymerase II transcription subunit 17 [Trichoplax sp. H2]|eukprot:RDD42987.1 Mediator of RNA polymerase II transcription subunit 17 [Trichoplax sp. H2]